jgi:hypothetical protein
VEYDGLAMRADVRRVVLCPQHDEAHRRNLARSGATTYRDYIDMRIRHGYGFLPAATELLRSKGWAILDTSGMTVDDPVTPILGTP